MTEDQRSQIIQAIWGIHAAVCPHWPNPANTSASDAQLRQQIFDTSRTIIKSRLVPAEDVSMERINQAFDAFSLAAENAEIRWWEVKP